jgi:L-ascorbate metabolism protein UlaG (beta-lactamase superfamily)
MKKLFVLLIALGSCSCTYNPLADRELRSAVGEPLGAGSALEITYFGNSTLLIDDGKTCLLVDGFFSRPGPLKTLFGKIGPERLLLEAELRKIKRPEAVLVGHSHHDHALDATAVADYFQTMVVGSRSFANLYHGSHAPDRASRLEVIPPGGATLPRIGKFTVHFAPSDHVVPYWFVQRSIKPDINAPLSMPAHYTKFGCGDVFAIHIDHPQGKIVITTTAGAKQGQFGGRKADVVFLSVGLLTKESTNNQNLYWHETVEATKPKLIVPVHWDDFSRKLSRGLKPGPGESSKKLMTLVKGKAGTRDVRVLNVRESIRIRHGRVYSPKPAAGSPGS